jgi:hypothetical protein
MSAWQNTLAPPPGPSADPEGLRRGAAVFTQAGCATCHAGRYFTNHDVIPQPQVGTQPARAQALAAFPRIFTTPTTYPPDTPVPLPPDPPVLEVPTDITPEHVRQLAYAVGDPSGGYKVPSLIGLRLTAPYLHDGGVAAGPEALGQDGDRFVVRRPDQLGLAGTLLRGTPADPASSLRVLLDRELREPTVNANRSSPSLQRSNADGSGHAYWVDAAAGFTAAEQDALVTFLLSLNDDPNVLPESAR